MLKSSHSFNTLLLLSKFNSQVYPCRALSSYSRKKDHSDLYCLLGLEHGCNQLEIRNAYYSLAKRLHPDMHQCRHSKSNSDYLNRSYIRISAAYEVLSDPKKRKLYDMENRIGFAESNFNLRNPESNIRHNYHDLKSKISNANVPAWIMHYRQLIERAVHGIELEDPANLSPNLGLGLEFPTGPNGKLGIMQKQFQGSFVTALQTAYFGPQLHDSVFSDVAFPEAFEGEERSHNGVGEIMHVVSGRTLLGLVRESSMKTLSHYGNGNDNMQSKLNDAIDTPFISNGCDSSYVEEKEEEEKDDAKDDAENGTETDDVCVDGRVEGKERRSSLFLKKEKKNSNLNSNLNFPEKKTFCPFVDLELEWNGRVIATSKRKWVHRNEKGKVKRKVNAESAKPGAGFGLGLAKVNAFMDEVNEEEMSDSICIYAANHHASDSQFDRYSKTHENVYEKRDDDDNDNDNEMAHGSVLLAKIDDLYNADKVGKELIVMTGDGKQTHTLLYHPMPLVRYMHWYRIEHGRLRCECRARRPWLPSSIFWLFEPRCSTHDIGGWYFEIFNEKKKKKYDEMNPYTNFSSFSNFIHNSRHGHNLPMEVEWRNKRLHPSVYIFAAAYKTLDEEYKKQANSNKHRNHLYEYVSELYKKFKF